MSTPYVKGRIFADFFFLFFLRLGSFYLMRVNTLTFILVCCIFSAVTSKNSSFPLQRYLGDQRKFSHDLRLGKAHQFLFCGSVVWWRRRLIKAVTSDPRGYLCMKGFHVAILDFDRTLAVDWDVKTETCSDWNIDHLLHLHFVYIT